MKLRHSPNVFANNLHIVKSDQLTRATFRAKNVNQVMQLASYISAMAMCMYTMLMCGRLRVASGVAG